MSWLNRGLRAMSYFGMHSWWREHSRTAEEGWELFRGGLMNRKATFIAVSGVVLGGIAVAAYQGIGTGEYAQVVASSPVTVTEPIFADVVSATAITAMVDTPREVCEDRQVEARHPERFGDKDGMVVGAVVGGLLGNQVGKGSGRKVATLAGAVGGAYAGREIDRRHEGGQRYTTTTQVCRMVSEPKEQVVGYEVQYRLDGQLGSTRVDAKPVGPQVQIGERERIVGFDVEWVFEGQHGSLRMDEEPGERLPIRDGVIQVASSDSGGSR